MPERSRGRRPHHGNVPTPLAVIFDLDDTLCDTTGAMLAALEAVSNRTPAFAGRSPTELHALQIRVMQASTPRFSRVP